MRAIVSFVMMTAVAVAGVQLNQSSTALPRGNGTVSYGTAVVNFPAGDVYVQLVAYDHEPDGKVDVVEIWHEGVMLFRMTWESDGAGGGSYVSPGGQNTLNIAWCDVFGDPEVDFAGTYLGFPISGSIGP